MPVVVVVAKLLGKGGQEARLMERLDGARQCAIAIRSLLAAHVKTRGVDEAQHFGQTGHRGESAERQPLEQPLPQYWAAKIGSGEFEPATVSEVPGQRFV